MLVEPETKIGVTHTSVFSKKFGQNFRPGVYSMKILATLPKYNKFYSIKNIAQHFRPGIYSIKERSRSRS